MSENAFNAEFRFTVEIEDMTWGAFTECTLPAVQLETEAVKEGGLNTFVHQLPMSLKPATITLKNGVGYLDDLKKWAVDTMKGKITRKKITIKSLGDAGKPFMVVTMNESFPTKWTGPQLKTDSNLVAIHTIEFTGGEVTLEFPRP
jgi:phage tail-like protein